MPVSHSFDAARAFQVAADARATYAIDDALFAETGPLVLSDAGAALQLAAVMNEVRRAPYFPERSVRAGDLMAAALIQEILRYLLAAQSGGTGERALTAAAAHLEEHLGDAGTGLLEGFAAAYPTTPVFRGTRTASEHLAEQTAGIPNGELALEELLMLRLANENPGFARFRDLHDDEMLRTGTAYPEAITALEEFFDGLPGVGPGGASLFETLRAPLRASPTSLSGQLEYIRANWAGLLGDRITDLLGRILRTLDVLAEERTVRGTGTGPPPVLDEAALRGADGEYERFSDDRSWMPRVVLMAKSTYVWLDQLSGKHGRAITRLDQVPDEELEALAEGGFTGLWLIGLWERSRASRRIKHLRGNPDAVASAYALYDYEIAGDLGGREAFADLRDRARQRGIRLASDMVPNHVGIDGRWVIEHPDWFLSLPNPPYPGYTFDAGTAPTPPWSSDATTGRRERTASSTTATTAPRCRGTTPPNSTTCAPRCARGSSRPSSTWRAVFPSSASTLP